MKLRQAAIIVFFLTSFFEVSRILDLKTIQGIVVLFGLLALGLLTSRQTLTFLKPMAGKILLLFVAWFSAAYFIAQQHAESSPSYLKTVLQGSILFIAGASLLSTVAEFQKLFKVLAAAGLVLSALGIVWGISIDGRYSLRSGEYADPNYYAMALLGITPIIFAAFPTGAVWQKVLAWGASALPLLISLRTLSRGGFVAILVMLGILFFLVSFKARIALGAAAVVGLVVLVAFMPPALRNRLAAAARIAPTDETQGPTESMVSLESRQTLFMTSINVTMAYPVFGVGPGNFGPMIADVGRAQGQNWLNMNTHNSYTQISSETGIPALLFYVLLIVFSLQSVIQVIRYSDNPAVRRMAGALLVSMGATLTCMIFLSEGYSALALFWLGLANGLHQLLPEGEEEELADGLEHAS